MSLSEVPGLSVFVLYLSGEVGGEPTQLEMEKLQNEDLCMILIDRGAVEDHLPNHVLASLERFKRQSLAPYYNEAEVDRLRGGVL